MELSSSGQMPQLQLKFLKKSRSLRMKSAISTVGMKEINVSSVDRGGAFQSISTKQERTKEFVSGIIFTMLPSLP